MPAHHENSTESTHTYIYIYIYMCVCENTDFFNVQTSNKFRTAVSYVFETPSTLVSKTCTFYTHCVFSCFVGYSLKKGLFR